MFYFFTRSPSSRAAIAASYCKTVASIARANLLAHWPLSEQSGTTAHDVSGNGRHGTYTGVTLGQPGIGDGNCAPYFDGVNDFANIYSTSLRDAFNGAEGTAMVWLKVHTAGVWTDSTNRYTFVLAADANNYIRVARRKDNNNRLHSAYNAATTIESQANDDYGGLLTWIMAAITWSAVADQVVHYINGTQWGATDTTLGTWAGNLSSTRAVIGALNTTPSSPWHGWLAHPAMWDTPLTAAQIARLYKL